MVMAKKVMCGLRDSTTPFHILSLQRACIHPSGKPETHHLANLTFKHSDLVSFLLVIIQSVSGVRSPVLQSLTSNAQDKAQWHHLVFASKPERIEKMLASLNTASGMGPDCISACVPKYCSASPTYFLSALFGISFASIFSAASYLLGRQKTSL